MMKTALVRSELQSEWGSCRPITDNLERAYRLALGENQTKTFLSPAFRYDKKFNRQIQFFEPDLIILLDHAARPPEFLETWLPDSNLPMNVPIWTHTYGDFQFSGDRWLPLESHLHGRPVLFFGASTASTDLLKKLVPSPFTDRIPFAVDDDIFHFEKSAREAGRARVGAEIDELVILYSGRISLQKNVTILVRGLKEWASRNKRKVKLVLAGALDDIGADLFGVELKPGQYSESVRASLTQDSYLNWIYLGALGRGELRDLYCGCDAYASLSLHHDEDFGMAPAEALCSGAPLILSEWGGYRDFPSFVHDSPGAVSLVGFAEGRDIRFDSRVFNEALDRVARVPYDADFRRRISLGARSVLSIEAIAGLIRKRIREPVGPFPGFNEFFRRLAVINRNPGRFSRHFFFDPMYEFVYGSYSPAFQGWSGQ